MLIKRLAFIQVQTVFLGQILSYLAPGEGSVMFHPAVYFIRITLDEFLLKEEGFFESFLLFRNALQ